MGRRNTGGVELREKSIRILFNFQGRQQKETLFGDKEPLPPTPANVRYAQRVAVEIVEKIKSGTFVYAEYFPHSPRAQKAQVGTVADLLDTWFAQADLKKSTETGYKRMIEKFWKPEIGHIRVDKLRHSNITTALKKKADLSGKTRNNYLSVLSAALDLAVHDDLIEKNPTDRIEAASWQKRQVDPFTQEEAEAILAHIRDKHPQQAWNLFEFWFFTGMRTGELIGLEWDDVDLRSKTVLVRQSFVTDQMEDTTKTSKPRTVNLNSRAMAALTRQKAWTYLAGNRVFHDPGTNQPWAYEQNARKRYWKPTLKALGIRYRRPYNCRHTYATLGLMAGANPAFMARQLGHGLKVFFEDYADWINGDQNANELAKIEANLSGSKIPEKSLKAANQA